MRALLGLLLVVSFSTCAPTTRDVQTSLASFESSSKQTADALVSLYQHAVTLQVALDANDLAGVNAFVDQLATDLDQLDQGSTALEAAENALQGAPELGTSSLKQGLGDGTGFMASLRKLFDIRGKYREANKAMSDAREAQWQAESDLAELKEGPVRDTALERLNTATKTQFDVGKKVATDVVTEVSTTLVTAPFKPVTLGGKVLKKIGGKIYEKGLTVLTSTRACDTDVKAPACVLGVEKTDDQGRVQAPTGTNSLVVSGGGYARVRIDKTEFATPSTVTTRELVPITSATAASVTKGDELDDDGFPVDPTYVPWILCFTRASSTATPTSGGCVKFDAGNNTTWDTMVTDQQDAWCKGKGFTDGTNSYMDEAGCRHTCGLFAASTCIPPCTPFVCNTP